MSTTSATGDQTVLVTGGSGYIGSWVAAALLNKGYRVRATLRSLAREAEMRAAIAKEGDFDDRLSFVEADLLSDEGWDAAVRGCDYVMHVASAMGVADNIRPAREGTHRVLTASAKAGVKRVVLTSSTAAAIPPKGYKGQIDESIWTDPDDKSVQDYPRAKTLGERDAWAFVAKSPGALSLTTVLPVFVQGPVLGSDYSQSIGIVAGLLKGAMPGLPRIGMSIVDVRDLADLHVLAMTAPQADGQRLIATGGFLWMTQIAALLHEKLGERAAKVPTRQIPDLMLRISALFDPRARFTASNIGKRTDHTSAKAQQMLGWRPRSAEQSIVETAESLIREGLV
jgi:dihydroflavonol-4-reductase